jgi:hypothetical protein
MRIMKTVNAQKQRTQKPIPQKELEIAGNRRLIK